MKIGIHSMVFVGDWNPAAARKAVSAAAQTGYDYIELSAINPETFDPAGTRKLLDEYGIGCTASLGLGPATDVASTDPVKVAAGMKVLYDGLSLVRDTGADMLCGVVYAALTKHAHRITSAERQASLEAVAKLADKAKESGISISLECVNRYESNLLNTANQCLEYLTELGRDNVSVHLDTYHMNIEESSIPGAIKSTAEAGKLGYFHIGESNRGYLGAGSVNWLEIFTALKDVHYDGYTAFESFSSSVVHRTFSDELAVWRDLWEEPMDLAQHARQFIRDGLGA